MRMAIQGIGISGGFGQGVSALQDALQLGAVTPQAVTVERSSGVDSFPAYRSDIEGLYEFFPKRALRRIDHFSKMTLHSACLALQDAGLLDSGPLPHRGGHRFRLRGHENHLRFSRFLS